MPLKGTLCQVLCEEDTPVVPRIRRLVSKASRATRGAARISRLSDRDPGLTWFLKSWAREIRCFLGFRLGHRPKGGSAILHSETLGDPRLSLLLVS